MKSKKNAKFNSRLTKTFSVGEGSVCFLCYVTYNPSLSDIYGEGYKPTLKVAHSGRNYQGSLLVNVTLGWKLGNYDIHAKHKIDFVHKRDKMV
jgi:hypothetical protein